MATNNPLREAALAMTAARLKKVSPERRSEIASAAAIAQAESMTPEQRKERARNAIAARWAKKKAKPAVKKGKASK